MPFGARRGIARLVRCRWDALAATGRDSRGALAGAGESDADTPGPAGVSYVGNGSGECHIGPYRDKGWSQGVLKAKCRPTKGVQSHPKQTHYDPFGLTETLGMGSLGAVITLFQGCDL